MLTTKSILKFYSCPCFYIKVQIYHTRQIFVEHKSITRGQRECTMPATNFASCRLHFRFLCGYQQLVEFVVLLLFNLVLMDAFDAFSTSSDSASVDLDF